ncbi:MAG: hypothetical protein EHM93_19630 [Bacteroidales bacterium]|nr:MAG: hypothetical protein EHM93_19630 [Bacteroidales bacterium]
MKTTYPKLLVLCSSILTCLILLHCSKSLSASSKADRTDTLKVQNNYASKDIVTINGITLNFDEIPFNGSSNIYQLPVAKSLKSAALENESRLLARSFNKQYIAFSRTTYTDSVNTTLMVYSKSGTLQWEVKSPLRIVNFRVSEDGNYTYAVWQHYTDTLETYYLTSYGKKGKVIDNIKGVEKFYTGKYADKVYYQRKDVNGNPLIGFLNYSGNQKWEKSYFPDTKISSVSNNGNNSIIVSSFQKLFSSVDSKGRIIWEHKVSKTESLGFFSFSKDSKYLSWLPEIGKIKVFNNKNGNIIFQTDRMIINNELIDPSSIKFVEGSDIIALIDFIGGGAIKIFFVTVEGKYLTQTLIDHNYLNTPFLNQEDDSSIAIYFDGVKVKTVSLLK